MTLELRQLRYFIAVAEEAHFGHAADRLRIAQPGLSKQIKRLEESMGVALLLRDKRHVEVTKAGRVLLDYARHAVSVVDRAVENTRAAAEGATGLLKIGGHSLAVYPIVGDAVREFAVRFPDVRVDFVPGNTAHSLDALVRRRIDIGVTFAPFVNVAPGTRYEPIGSVEPVIAVPVGHRLTAFDRIPRSELLKETVFAWPREVNVPLVDGMRKAMFGDATPQTLIEVGDVVEMLVRAASGEGVAMVDPSVMRLGVANVEFRSFEDRTVTFEYGLIWLETAVSRWVARFVDVARELANAS